MLLKAIKRVIGHVPFIRMPTTARHIRFWSERKIDWSEAYTKTIDHPHRRLIIEELQKKPFQSLCEIGCASAPNLLLVKRHFPHVEVGGCDVNKDAIEEAKKMIPNGIFDVRSADNLFFSDKSVDVVLTDACLIYLGSKRIKKALKEIKRIARLRVVFVEFHEKKWWKRLGVMFMTGNHLHNYEKLLEEAGFYDIQIKKMSPHIWPKTQWEYFGHVITASL